MRRVYSFEFVARNKVTQRLSFRSLNDIHRFRVSSSIVSARSTKSDPLPLIVNYKAKLKLLAVDMAIKKIINRLIFLEDLERSKLGKFVHVLCPEQILSWRFEDWLETEANRVLWFKVIDHQMSAEQFATWMMLKNYAAMRNCLYDLADSYMYSNSHPTPTEVMASVVKFHKLDGEISQQMQKNKAKTGKVRTELIVVNFMKRTMGSLVKKPDDLFLISAIESSYMLRFHKSREQQAEMRLCMAEERLQKEIQLKKKRFNEEQFATTCAMDTYFNLIASLRERIAKLTRHYDTEYARLDGNITFLKTGIEKIHANRWYLEEQIAWFKESVRLFIDGEKSPKQRSSTQPDIKNLQVHKERKLTLLRSQKSLMSITSQTKRSMRPRTKLKKEPSSFIGSENFAELLEENVIENAEENPQEIHGVENLEQNLG